MSSVRRVYFYLVTLISLGILAGGAGTLLALIFDIAFSSSSTIGGSHFNQQQFSLGLAMLIIGGPLWFFFWKSIQRNVRGSSIEIGAALRKFFLNFILTVTALVAVLAAQNFLKWLLEGAPQARSASGSLATFIVAAIVWYFHWRVSESEGRPSEAAKTLRRWYIYIVAGWGLVSLSLGLVQLIDGSARYLPVWGNSLVSGNYWAGPFQENIPAILLGGALWAFHWFRMSRGDVDSTLRQVYIYLLAIVVSSVAGLTALVMGLYRSLVWAMGAAGPNSGYFQFLGWVIPTIAVSAAIWFYHQAVASEESDQVQERRLSSKRVHYYIMSFIGLGTLTAGLIILLGTILNLIINGIDPAIAIQSGWWQKQLSLSLALLIVAMPLWWYYWNQIIKMAAGGGITEWRAKSRRIYLYVIIGATIVTLAADLVNVVYQILSGLLGSHFGLSVLQKSKWSIQSLLVALPLLIYHWQIARQDQRRGAESGTNRKMVSALIDSQSRDLILQLENQMGSKIRVLEYIDPATGIPVMSAEELAKLIGEIQASPTPQVMLVIRQSKLVALPYEVK